MVSTERLDVATEPETAASATTQHAPPPRTTVRPAPIVVIRRVGRWVMFGLLALALWRICVAPTPAGLTPEGQRALGVFVVCVVLWVTHLLPLMVTGLLAMVLLPALQVVSAETAFAVLGNPAVLFILGAFILAAGMADTGLSQRLALGILNTVGSSPRRLPLGILCGAAFLSFWMPEHAVAAMLLPITMQLAHALKLRHRSSPYGRQLFLALAWGAVIGGVATLLGGARAPLALAILHDYTSAGGGPAQTIGFLEWMVPVLPVVLGMLAVAAAMLRWGFACEVESIAPARDALHAAIAERGPMTWRERGVGLIVVATVAAWIFLGPRVGLAPIALAGAVSLFVFRLVDWESVEAYVNWGIILMYGGAIALGSALAQTGAAAWLADRALAGTHPSPFVLLALLAAVAKVLTEGISNTAVVALLLPLALTLGENAGIPLPLIVFAVATPAGLAFCLPMGTPPNAIAFAGGYLRLRDVFLPGLLLNVVSWVLFMAAVKWYWPLIGLEVGP